MLKKFKAQLQDAVTKYGSGKIDLVVSDDKGLLYAAYNSDSSFFLVTGRYPANCMSVEDAQELCTALEIKCCLHN